MQLTRQPFHPPLAMDAQNTAVDAPLDQIAYCCIATPSVQALGMQDMLEAQTPVAHERITGVLMWEGRLMIHWLEGPHPSLTVLWAKIQNDPRQHCLVPLVHHQGVKKRWFKHWEMQPATRNEMMAIVREAKEQASQSDAAHAKQWQHAISLLSILLDPDFTAFYGMAASAAPQDILPNV